MIVSTILVGLGGMAGALLLGVTLAVLTTRFVVRGRGLITVLAVIALISPPFIGAYAWIILFGANGLVRRFFIDLGVMMPPIYGATGVVLVFAFKFFPHVYLIVAGALANMNRSLEEAAESLGATPTERFFKVTLPMALPAVSAAALLTFVLSISDFGTPRMIGRDFDVLATEAFTLFSAELGGNPGMASTISLVLVLISMLVVLMQRHVQRCYVYHGTLIARIVPRRLAGWRTGLVHVLAYAIVAIGAIPAAIVAFYSFRRTSGPIFRPGFGLQSYERVLYVGSTMTMPVKIYLSVLDGEYGTASALSTILIAITALAVYGAPRVSGNEARSLV